MIKRRKVKVAYEPEPEFQAGRIINLTSLPKGIKKAKKKFKVGKDYVIQEPVGKMLNTPMAVFIKGKDKKLYHIGFEAFVQTARTKVLYK